MYTFVHMLVQTLRPSLAGFPQRSRAHLLEPGSVSQGIGNVLWPEPLAPFWPSSRSRPVHMSGDASSAGQFRYAAADQRFLTGHSAAVHEWKGGEKKLLSQYSTHVGIMLHVRRR